MKSLEAQKALRTERAKAVEGPKFLGDRLEETDEAEEEEDDETAFPDLPPELKPQRADGTGTLTKRDVREIDQTGILPHLSPAEVRRADQALEHLESKMNIIAAEFTGGQINHAQFQAIYTRYCEQRNFIERIRSRDPQFGAWDAVATEGATASLRKQLAALVLGCAIVDNRLGEVIRTFGDFRLESDMLEGIVSSLQEMTQERNGSAERSTQIEGGRWLSIVSGDFCSTIVIFSHEPSKAQRKTIADIHGDFEHANQRSLKKMAVHHPAGMVYPHRTLFDEEE